MVDEKRMRAEQNLAAAHPRRNAESVLIHKSVHRRHAFLKARDAGGKRLFQQAARHARKRARDEHRLFFLYVLCADALCNLGFYHIRVVDNYIVNTREITRVRVALHER